jgi:hypothetical protein
MLAMERVEKRGYVREPFPKFCFSAKSHHPRKIRQQREQPARGPNRPVRHPSRSQKRSHEHGSIHVGPVLRDPSSADSVDREPDHRDPASQGASVVYRATSFVQHDLRGEVSGSRRHAIVIAVEAHSRNNHVGAPVIQELAEQPKLDRRICYSMQEKKNLFCDVPVVEFNRRAEGMNVRGSLIGRTHLRRDGLDWRRWENMTTSRPTTKSTTASRGNCKFLRMAAAFLSALTNERQQQSLRSSSEWAAAA